MQIYHVETQEDYDALMVELEIKGFDMRFVKNIRFFNMGKDVIYVTEGLPVQVSSLYFAKNNFTHIAIQKYKVKTLKGLPAEEAGKKLSVSVRKFNKALRQSEKEVSDPVNNPKHYTQGELEVIDILQDKLTPEEFEGFLKGNVLKYTFREGIKNGTEDMKKGAWYMSRLIDFRKEQEG